MTEADFLATGYYGLQTGILGVTALFTLVFAYIGGLHLFLRKEPLITRLAVYILFLFAFAFLMMFLYSASLFGEEWQDLRRASGIGDGLQGYSGQSVFLMRLFGAIIGLATIAFVSIETFRPRK
ncbi:MAG: hypothetical protein VXW22_05125 [Pseudomonadota bacterium]|jgi:hypothetical protein|nr:hypothetical protein [Pseudomonadota bacterium]